MTSTHLTAPPLQPFLASVGSLGIDPRRLAASTRILIVVQLNDFFFQLARLSPHTHTLTKTGFIWPRFAAPSLTDRNSMHVWLRGMFVLWMRCDTFSLDLQLYYQIQIVAWLVCLGSHCFGHHVSLTVHHRPLFWLPIKPSAASLYPRFPLNIYWSMPY